MLQPDYRWKWLVTLKRWLRVRIENGQIAPGFLRPGPVTFADVGFGRENPGISPKGQ